jgi:hypothetical protein
MPADQTAEWIGRATVATPTKRPTAAIIAG